MPSYGTKPSRPKDPRGAMQAFTPEHFQAWGSRLILDTGEPWDIEDYQMTVFEPLLGGVREVWTIIPEANCKTTLMACYALYHCQFTPYPWVPIAASSRDQAEILARQAYGIIRATPGMDKYFKIYEGYREIRSLRNGGRGIKVYAADTGSGDGVIPTLCICDEGHRWPDLGLYRLWKNKLGKRGGQIVMISTAGEPGGDFETQRDAIRALATQRTGRGAHIRSEGINIVMNEWRVEKDEWITDMQRVKEANPFSGITVETLQGDYESPTTDISDWKRLKPLAVDTPLPTPDGWTTMGEVEVGDQILNGEGLPTTVEAVTPVYHDEDCYRLTFSDGASIVASGDHLWEVEDSRFRHRRRVVSTEQLAGHLHMRDGRGRTYSRWRVRLSGRRVGSSAPLPIDPYILGIWLGDGTAGNGRITNVDPEIWEEIERHYELGVLAPSRDASNRVHTLLGLRTELRGLSLLRAKRIPEAYLLSSEQDRWSLLQGLIDSDGTVVEGRVIFNNTNARLIEDVRRLVWSLGRPCLMREGRAMLNGVDCGANFALEIPCDQRHPVARLPRKASRLRFAGKQCDHRRIRSIERIESVPVRCIQVEASDSMFLAGEAMIPTHNCNRPSRTMSAAITESEWQNAQDEDFDEIPEGEHVDLGADVAWKHDTFSIVPLWQNREPEINRNILGVPEILTPPRDGSTMHPDTVKAAFLKINDRNPIDAVVMDLERAEDIAAWLEDELGVTVIDRPQGNVNHVADYDAFMKGLRSKTLTHTGDHGLYTHVMNAIVRTLPGDKKRFDRPSQSRARRKQQVRVIDALTAAAMVNEYAGEAGPSTLLLAWR